MTSRLFIFTFACTKTLIPTSVDIVVTVVTDTAATVAATEDAPAALAALAEAELADAELEEIEPVEEDEEEVVVSEALLVVLPLFANSSLNLSCSFFSFSRELFTLLVEGSSLISVLILFSLSLFFCSL